MRYHHLDSSRIVGKYVKYTVLIVCALSVILRKGPAMDAPNESTNILPELVEGAELQIRVKPCTSLPSATPSSDTGVQTSVKIIKAYRPFTMSPVLLVSIPPTTLPLSASEAEPSAPTQAILKLYDRRCVSNSREQFDESQPWSLEKEREYRQYLASVASGSASTGDFDNPAYMWENDVSDGEFEAYLKRFVENMYDAERTTYAHLAELQGKEIPVCYGAVEWDITIRDGEDTYTDTIPGLLLEYVSPLSLRQFVQTWKTRNLPDAVLVALCEKAVAVVERISDFEVLNADVRMDNFLVREPFFRPESASSSGERELTDHPVALIDLGQCRLRRQDESEDEWVRAKWSQDESGAVGFGLMGLVKQFVGEGIWTYKRSLRYYRPIEEPEES